MARELDGYSKAIGWLKLLLPLIGLGILSTLFLVAKGTQIERTEIADGSLAPDGTVERVRDPDYSGVTGDGTSVSITAETAWPTADGSGAFAAERVSARFDMPDGGSADITAAGARLEPERDVLALRGDVVVETGSGWTMRSERLDAALDWTRISSDTDVRTTGPIGTLDAGEMLIARDNEPGSDYLMEFDGGVHLVYRP